jgi:hypothetical protein
MRWTAADALLALAAAGCGATGAARNPSPAYSPGVIEEPITAVIAAALDADRRLESADSLWAKDATVVANGELRTGPPRFAGVEAGGEVAISSSRLEVRQSLVWVYLEYRWLSMTSGLAREGKATILLTPRADGSGWRIVHAHSSTAGSQGAGEPGSQRAPAP